MWCVVCGVWTLVVRAASCQACQAATLAERCAKCGAGRALVPDAAGKEAENSIVAVVVESLQGRVRRAVLLHGGSGVLGIGRGLQETMGVRREAQHELRPEGHRLHIG